MESDGGFVDRDETKELLLSYPQIQVVYADYVTATNEEDGVGLAIEKFAL